MTSTVAQVIADCRRDYLTTGRNQEINKLNGSLTAGATSATLTYALKGIKEGSSLGINLEEIHVWTIDGAGLSASAIERGMNGSTDATHADGDLVYVNPLYSGFRILEAMNRTIADLSGPDKGLYQMTAKELTANTAVTGYDLAPTNMIEVHSVYTQHTSTGTKTWLPVNHWRVDRSAETDDFASGIALHVYEPIFNGTQLRVLYKQELTSTLSAVTDVVETVTGLESTAVDLVAMGAALDLLVGKEIDHNETRSQRSSRRSQEVPPGSWTASTRNLQAHYRDRVASERKRLDARYPTQMKVPVY